MSVKLIKLHWRIYYWTLTGKIKKLGSRLSLNSNSDHQKRVLIFFPMDEPSFRVAIYTFRDLGLNESIERNYKFVIKEQFKDLFHLNSGIKYFIQNTKFENMLNDEKEVLEQLKNLQYDIVIDLNTNFHLGISRLISLLNSKIKVGFSNYFSDKFYNIQLDISKSGVMEKGFKQVQMMLTS